MGYEFDRMTAVTPTETGYDTELDAGWVVGGGVNGGYLLSILGNAIRATLDGKPDPFSLSAYYVGASTPRPAQVTTNVIRDGGSFATVGAELSQGGQLRIAALASYGDLGALPDDVRTTAPVPELPSIDDCISTSLAPDDVKRMAPLLDRFDLRLDPDCVGWSVGAPSGNGMIQGWIRLADGRDPDSISLLMFCDALPPVTFDLGLFGWTPTLELTCQVRANPAPGWLKVRHATANLAGGMFEEDCEVWDSTGRLVAQSRQLARVPR